MSRRPPAAPPSNPQMPIRVKETDSGIPTAVRVDGRWEQVGSVVSRRDLKEDLAGEKRAVKTYFEITIGGGEPLTIFRNHVTGSWYRADNQR